LTNVSVSFLGKKPSLQQTNMRNRFQTALASWNSRHSGAGKALLKSLEGPDLIKVITVKDSAAAIWTRLKNEYGKSLDFEYI